MSAEDALVGFSVLVPRPRPQGARVVSLIEDQGGRAIWFPVIEILPPESYSELDDLLRCLDGVDMLVMVSVAAVDAVIHRLDALDCAIPDNLTVAAIGPKTAARCEAAEIPVRFNPGQAVDSEGLLECLQDFGPEGKEVVIVRAQSGREKLKSELEVLGARVRYVQGYQRRVTKASFTSVIDNWRAGEINAVLITSVSILKGLLSLLGPENQALLFETPAVALSGRIAEQCREAGIRKTSVVDIASDRGMLAKLIEIRSRSSG